MSLLDDIEEVIDESRKDLEERLEEIRRDLRAGFSPALAERAGTKLLTVDDETFLEVPYFRRTYLVETADFEVRTRDGSPADVFTSAMVIYYLATADGAPETGKWVSLREIPGGRFYASAFQGYTGDVLVRQFGCDLASLDAAARRIPGKPEALGDVGFSFRVLPRVRLAFAYWRGDEEFPPDARVLFDSCCHHYLPCDALAVLGAHLVRRLILSSRNVEREG